MFTAGNSAVRTPEIAVNFVNASLEIFDYVAKPNISIDSVRSSTFTLERKTNMLKRLAKEAAKSFEMNK